MKKIFIIITMCVGLVVAVVGQTVGALVGATNVLAEDEMVGEVGGESGLEDDVGENGEGGDLEDDEAGDLDEGEPGEEENVLPQIYIKAVNPGYKIDGVNNVGEMIEIARTGNSDAPILLAGTAISYTNSSGNTSVLVEFPEHSWMTGETLLLRLASSPGSELANLTYSKTLAFNAGLSLIVNGEVVDEVCWTGKGDCYRAFSSAKPTTLVRNLETGEFEHNLVYVPEYAEENYREEAEETTDTADNPEAVIDKPAPQCYGLQFSEILSYYETAKSEQFVEFYNTRSGVVNLDGCKLRYKNKNYLLSGTVDPEGYYVYYPVGFGLTKNPTNSNKLEIIDTDSTVVDTLSYPNGQRKGTAYAYLGVNEAGGEIWKITYAPTPGAPNNYQEFRTCEAGKVINEATGNCVKVTSVSEKVCQEGYYLNVLTGRCKKITVKEEKTCPEGYYLNPETNRCRKVVENKGADYGLTPESYEEDSSFVALYAVLGVVGAGLLYLAWEFRREIGKLGRRVLKLFKRGD